MLSNKYLFNPFNFNKEASRKDIETELAKQLSPPTRGQIGLRFAPMREMITNNLATISRGAAKGTVDQLDSIEITGTKAAQSGYEHGIRWNNYMMCQLVTNAYNLFTYINKDIVIEKNCFWARVGKGPYQWVTETPACADIVLISARNNDMSYGVRDLDGNIIEDRAKINKLGFKTYEAYNEKWALHNKGFDNNEINNLDKIGTLYSDDNLNLRCSWGDQDDDYKPEYHIYIRKCGLFTKPLKKGAVTVVKITVPGHYTIALIYPDEKRIEIFDSGGTFDMVGYRDGDENKPYSRTQDQRSKTRKSKHSPCIFEGLGAEHEIAICCLFKKMFPTYELVGLNTIDLQVDDRDAHCQTWVWLFIYMRHIYPKLSTKKVLEFFHKHAKDKTAYDLVDNWWKYLINFIPQNHPNKDDIWANILLTVLETHRNRSIMESYGGEKNLIIYKSNNTKFYSWLKMFY